MSSSASLARMLIALASKHYTEHGTRKPDHYFEVYASYLGDARFEKIDILELGVSSGASLLIWKDFFPNANIVGLDIRAAPERLQGHIERGEIQFVQGDQSSKETLLCCIEKSRRGTFDIIIDDASHVGWLSRASFEFLFLNGLRDGGLYFIEDYGTGYMKDFYDGESYAPPPCSPNDKIFPSHHHGMVGWMKQLIDELHGSAISPTKQSKFPIAWIQFFPSIAVIGKLTEDGLLGQSAAPPQAAAASGPKANASRHGIRAFLGNIWQKARQ